MENGADNDAIIVVVSLDSAPFDHGSTGFVREVPAVQKGFVSPLVVSTQLVRSAVPEPAVVVVATLLRKLMEGGVTGCVKSCEDTHISNVPAPVVDTFNVDWNSCENAALPGEFENDEMFVTVMPPPTAPPGQDVPVLLAIVLQVTMAPPLTL